jgi:acyl-CoA thioesterase FadM
VAALWPPPATEADDRGLLPAPLVWAALDCPAFWALMLDPPAVDFLVTGEMTAVLFHPVPAGRPLVVTGWVSDTTGRRTRVGAAIHDEHAVLLAVAEQTLVATSWGFQVSSVRTLG